MVAHTFAGSFVAPTLPKQRQSQSVVSRAAERPYGIWYPNAKIPPHLDGSLPGDFGFDPLGLGMDEYRMNWYAEAEKVHGRWCMSATAGILAQEVLTGKKWWLVGEEEQQGIPLITLIAMEIMVMGALETARYIGFKKTGTSGLLFQFPFDPLKMNNDTMAAKELKNGRLAMISIVGYWLQALATRENPIQCLKTHISDPLNYNVIYSTTRVLNYPLAIGRVVPDDDPALMGIPEQFRDAELFDYMAKAINGSF